MGYIGNQSAKIVYTNIDRFRGEVADITALNAITGMASGDMYKLISTNHAYMYDGSAWVDMGDIEGPQGLKGTGITSIVRTAGDGSEGTTDTYTITYDDTSTSTFNVTNGTAGTINHITRTAGTGAAGTTDTYTAYADLAETQPLGTFNVYNGVNGLDGIGDMSKSIYDTNNNGKVDSSENADTVNGLTVETAVPVGAVFTDTETPLNNTLTSVSTIEALTANQGKVLKDLVDTKQYTLVSGTNIKTINGGSILGSGNISTVDTTKLPLTGGTMTGAITAIRETKVAMAANNIDLATGNLFTKTISGVTTLTISNALAAGNVNSFVLELTNGGSAVITWFGGVKWAGGIAPTLTASGKDILGFYSHDGGTTWNILGINKDVK